MKIKERHNLIDPRIGSFKEEKEAYVLACLLTWLLPVVVIASFLIDLLIILVYHLVLHPSRYILKKVMLKKLPI